MNRALVSLVLMFMCGVVFAQDGKYMIFFSDRNGSTYSISNPQAYLSQRSLDRRARNNILITENDLPVNEDYVLQVSNTGASVLHVSRWINGVLVAADEGQLVAISNLTFVTKAEYVAPPGPAVGGRIRKSNQKKDSSLELANRMQSSMIGLDDMHGEDISGSGVVVAILDAGFEGVDIVPAYEHLRSEGRIQMTADIIGNSGSVFQYDNHGSEVLSVMAARIENSYAGGAFGATFQLFVTEDVGSEYRIEEYNWLIAAEKADSAGADIINTSLGYNLFDDPSMDYSKDQLDGKTAVVSQAAQMALAKGMVVVVSAGNEGNNQWKLVNPPADVEGVITVGSVTSIGSVSGFSSVGPTADGRIKPDVVALGSGVSVIKSSGSLGFATGTSVAAPLVASLAAGLMQKFPDLTVNQLVEAIVQSGSMAGQPNNEMGYGVPHYLAAIEWLNEDPPPPIPPERIIYPNPVTDRILIDLGAFLPVNATVRVYGLSGQRLKEVRAEMTIRNNPLELDMNDLSPGIYVLKVEYSGSVKTMKMVKH
jgi:serine protease AprX